MSDETPKDTLGATLRKARESRGLSLDQVSSATKIHVKIIQDLEMDRYDELPAEPFTRGFIYNYARFLGLPPQKIFADFKGFLEEKWKKVQSRSQGVTGYAFERPDGEQSRRMLWAIMIGMFIFGVLVIVIFKPSLKHRKHGHIEELRAGATPVSGAGASPNAAVPSPAASVLSALPSGSGSMLSPTPTPTSVAASPSPSTLPTPSPVESATAVVAAGEPSPSPAVSVVPSPTPLPSVTPSAVAMNPVPEPSNRTDQLQNGSDYEPSTVKHKFIFKALSDVTVQYRCDDKSLMRFTLRKDRILVLRGKEAIRLQVSNPNAIAVSLGTKGYIPLSEARRTFIYNNNATFVQPLELRDKMAENWNGAVELPETPDPAPEAATEVEATPESSPVPALSPTP